MRVLVIGKNGQLGRSIHKKVNADDEIHQNLNADEFVFVGRNELSLSSDSDIAQYFNNNDDFDIIINCAAYTSVDEAEEQVTLANQVNHLAIKKLAHIANSQQAKLIHISTDYVFDGNSDQPYLESDIPNPINIYGKTKLAGEQALQMIMPTNGIIIRTSWVFSEFGTNFVKSMLRLGRERSELNVVSDQIGSPTFATDLAETILKISRSENKEQPTEIYHYSNDSEACWHEFAQAIFKIAEIECNIIPITTANYLAFVAARPLNTVLNNTKIIKKFGIKSKCYKESLSECLDLLRGRTLG